jgi:hypothetical protein
MVAVVVVVVVVVVVDVVVPLVLMFDAVLLVAVSFLLKGADVLLLLRPFVLSFAALLTRGEWTSLSLPFSRFCLPEMLELRGLDAGLLSLSMLVALNWGVEGSCTPFAPEPIPGLLPSPVPKKLEFAATSLLWLLTFKLGAPEPEPDVLVFVFVCLPEATSSSLEKSSKWRGLLLRLLL